MFRSRSARYAALSLVLLSTAVQPAFAVSKDMIQLQTQIQQLQDAIARLQQSNDERMGVLKDLVQQTADSVNKMSVAVDGMKLQIQNQQDASAAKTDQLSGQIQSLNDSLDELKARMAKMQKSLGDIQSQQQSANALLNNLPQPGTSLSGSTVPSANSASTAPAPAAPTTLPPPSAGPSSGEMYRTAYGDYIAAKYPLATSEFNDLIKAYPDDNLSGNAYFYIGEMDVKNLKFSLAVKSYDQVIERYPDNAKVPAAHLHKGFALISMKQTEAGVRELRALIQRFPNSPEASQARSKLSSLRITVAPRD